MIPVANIECYPSWFLPVLQCLHSSVLCKNPVTSLYLASVSPNFPIFFCIKSLMLNLTNYIQIHTPLCRVCLSVPADSLPTCTRDPFHTDKRPRESAALFSSCCSFPSRSALTSGDSRFKKPQQITVFPNRVRNLLHSRIPEADPNCCHPCICYSI